MIKTQYTTDKFAMALSLACAAHCFFTPSFLILTSGFLSFSVDNEFIHALILLVATPISIYALFVGYRNHKTFSFLPVGILGLFLLLSAVLLGESMLGEFGEKARTLPAPILAAYSHFQNSTLATTLDCSCHQE